MPFFKTHEVPKEFFNLFLIKAIKKKIAGDSLNEHPMLQVPLHTGETSDVMFRYYKRSGESSVEDTMSYFPSISVQDFQPEINRQLLWGKDYVEGMIDEVNSRRELIYLPIPMIYRFQLSAVTKRLKEVQGVQDWFMQNFHFQRPDCFEFNCIETDEGKVFDAVDYMAYFGEIPREDGKFEYGYDFTLKVFVHAKSKMYKFASTSGGEIIGGNFVDTVEKIKFALKMQRITDFERILQYEFELT